MGAGSEGMWLDSLFSPHKCASPIAPFLFLQKGLSARREGTQVDDPLEENGLRSCG